MRRCVGNWQAGCGPSLQHETYNVEGVHHCVLAACLCGNVEQPLVREPQFRKQRGALAPCLAVQELLVSRVCNFLVRQPDPSAWHVYVARRLPCESVQVSHPLCAPGAQGCGGGLASRSCRLRCRQPVSSAPRNSAHRTRPRLARLVRPWFSTTGRTASAALPRSKTGSSALLISALGCVVPSGHLCSTTLCGWRMLLVGTVQLRGQAAAVLQRPQKP